MKIRGHHLVCTYCFCGSGKVRAEDFFGVENAIPRLLERLRANPQMEMTVVADLDDVCDECPLLRPEGCGRSADPAAQNAKLREWDHAILHALDLHEGEHIRAMELEERLRMRIPDIRIFCKNCTSAGPSGWQEYRKAIRDGLWAGMGGSGLF